MYSLPLTPFFLLWSCRKKLKQLLHYETWCQNIPQRSLFFAKERLHCFSLGGKKLTCSSRTSSSYHSCLRHESLLIISCQKQWTNYTQRDYHYCRFSPLFLSFSPSADFHCFRHHDSWCSLTYTQKPAMRWRQDLRCIKLKAYFSARRLMLVQCQHSSIVGIIVCIMHNKK